MSERRALWASTEEPGGIATYVEEMRRTPLWDRWQIRHIVTHRHGPPLSKISVFARGALRFLGDLLRRRPDVVHLHAACNTSFLRKGVLLWISRSFRVPVVLHMHGSLFESEYADSPTAVQAIIRATLRRANAVVALGESRAAGLRAMAPDARIIVIRNAIRLGERQTQHVSDQPVRVVFLGVIGDRKGTFRLLDAWARLGRSDALLTIAGDGEVERARQRVKDLHLEDTVEVRDWLSPDAVDDLLSHAQVLALPSRHEGQPMAVLEAMARGLCVVAGDVGGLPEMIGDGCGVLIPPDDIEAIAAALKLVICDHRLRAQYGAAAHARVVSHFDLSKVWQQVDALYDEVSR